MWEEKEEILEAKALTTTSNLFDTDYYYMSEAS